MRGDQHDDRAATYAIRDQEETHCDVLIIDAIAELRAAQAALHLLPRVVTDVDTHTYRGRGSAQDRRPPTRPSIARLRTVPPLGPGPRRQ
ncbi:hypothetical protein ACFV1C_38550 [Streptomyces sp. NPDC059605]|uniref:hypothetical protein n=1 Tax=unclassified Streptomyces TaxID=2593676 RepID=UPI00368029D5